MKQINISSFLLIIGLALSWVPARAESCCLLDMGIFNQPVNSTKLQIRVRPTIAVTTGNFSSCIFVVKYPSSYNVTLSETTAVAPNLDYGEFFVLPGGTNAGFTYYVIYFQGSNAVSWALNQEIVILTLSINNGTSGTGTFQLTTDAYASSISNGDPFYLELAANGEGAGGNGQQGVFYQASTTAALPVELLEFNARAQEDGSAKLDWKSANETGFSHYEVEHSADGLQFANIGRVDAKGTPGAQVKYDFIHDKPNIGHNYYRLRMVDISGAHQYSNTRQVRFGDLDSRFSLLPNPTSGPLVLLCSDLDDYKSELRYQMTDNNGKLLLENTISDEKTRFDLSPYATGIYYLNILTNDEQIRQFKVILTRP